MHTAKICSNTDFLRLTGPLRPKYSITIRLCERLCTHRTTLCGTDVAKVEDGVYSLKEKKALMVLIGRSIVDSTWTMMFR